MRNPTVGAIWLRLLLCAAMLLGSGAGIAKEAAPTAADPVLEARMQDIAAELRCLVCQNQTIADSNADLAVDLRRQVREMLTRGDSREQILDYMTARYGDFVLYRPPLKAETALLWFAPAVLLVLGVLILLVVLRRRSRLADDQFEPEVDPYVETPDDPNAEPPSATDIGERPTPSQR
ncbi:cytochrome c-type biogenesis protein [Piscinibacter sakaiensis]|uniref:cytochrome c-type biogenesis protein n=1 Tax=Piscinibacter sakaiensis TaxID=1547922 RepID=UPI003AB10264